MSDQVLIVDDDAQVRELIQLKVAEMGLESVAAGNAQEALALATAEPHPALVLLDIDLPGASGLEVLQRLKTLDEGIQVVMVTGHHDLATVRAALRQGAYDYLAKPFALEDLATSITRALERSQLLRQNQDYQRNLERMVEKQTEDIRETRDIALLTLAKLAESRDN